MVSGSKSAVWSHVLFNQSYNQARGKVQVG